jgi:hypothetical protein
VILFVEATEPSLENRHIELNMQYAANLKVYPQSLLTIVYIILDMKMFIINNQIQLKAAYCILSSICLFSSEGSVASTNKITTGDILKVPSESRNHCSMMIFLERRNF